MSEDRGSTTLRNSEALAPPRAQPIACFRVQLLGPLAVSRDEVPLDTARWQRWVDSLLILLVTSLGRRRSRDEIIDALWPDATPQAGASNLRYIVHLLRRNLGGGDPSPVLSERGWIVLSPAYGWEVDLERFEELIAAGQDVACLQEAAALRRGEALIEARYDDWAIPIRNRMQREWREVCLRLGHLHHARGAAEVALRWLDQALEADPLDEEALGEVPRC